MVEEILMKIKNRNMFVDVIPREELRTNEQPQKQIVTPEMVWYVLVDKKKKQEKRLNQSICRSRMKHTSITDVEGGGKLFWPAVPVMAMVIILKNSHVSVSVSVQQ